MMTVCRSELLTGNKEEEIVLSFNCRVKKEEKKKSFPRQEEDMKMIGLGGGAREFGRGRGLLRYLYVERDINNGV